MKLFLSSTGLPVETRQYFLELLDKNHWETKVCFVPTAADPETDKWFVDAALNELKELGIPVEIVDLKNENEESLRTKLQECDVIYVNGGNTFYLLDWVRKSGFETVVKDMIMQGKIYVGVSAGSIIVGPNIETAKEADPNIANLSDLSGLNFVPFLLDAHIDSEEQKKKAKELASNYHYPFVALNNKQAVVVTPSRIEIVGQGEKLFFNGFEEKI